MKYKSNRSMLNRNHLGKQIFRKVIFVFISIAATAVWSVLVFTELINPLTINWNDYFHTSNVVNKYFNRMVCRWSSISQE